MYGTARYETYGMPLGMRLSPINTVSKLYIERNGDIYIEREIERERERGREREKGETNVNVDRHIFPAKNARDQRD